MSSPREDLQECRQNETGVENPANKRADAHATPTLRNHWLGWGGHSCPPPLKLISELSYRSPGVRHSGRLNLQSQRRRTRVSAHTNQTVGDCSHAQAQSSHRKTRQECSGDRNL